MLIQIKRGTTQQNDELLLEVGELSIDLDKMALRIHDGETQGGFEMIAAPANTPFKGEVPTSELISGDDLATLIGMTHGTDFNSNEPWLKFIDPVDGRTKYIAKKPYRHSVGWAAMGNINAVDGSRIETIQGQQYRVRLLKGANVDPIVGPVGFDVEDSWGSEWNRLMYRIAVGNPNDVFDSGEPHGDWAQYTDEELGVAVGDGRFTWCQETGTLSSYKINRGNTGISNMSQFISASTLSTPQYGWRPCLELVE